MFQNVWLAGLEIPPEHSNLPIHLVDIIKTHKVMDGFMDLETTYECGRPLLKEFFPGQLCLAEEKWWQGDYEPYDSARRAQRATRGISRRENPAIFITSIGLVRRRSLYPLQQVFGNRTEHASQGRSTRRRGSELS